MANSCVVYIFISLLIIASITLLAVKQNIASLTTSLVATLLVVFTLIPQEPLTDNGSWVYSSAGAARFVPGTKSSLTQKQEWKNKNKTTMPHPQRRRRYNTQLTGTLGTGAPPVAPVDTTPPSNLPLCSAPPHPPTDKEMRDHIRNNGLYGVHGNQSCRKMQRSSVADKGLLQPLGARTQLLQFLAVDQLHAKDTYLIPREKRVIS